MDWSIQEVARLAGTTSRTLRHYGELGLLEPSRIGQNGYRFYNAQSVARLQRILMLRELGLGLPAIAEVLAGQTDTPRALADHLRWLRQEKDRLDRQIGSVETTIRKIEGEEQLMAEEMLDGFDHTQYRDEVESRWGAQAYADSNRWWTSMTKTEQEQWMLAQKQLAADWAAAAVAGETPTGAVAQALAERHARWLGSIPGTPGSENHTPTKEYFVGLGDLYVADDRFAQNYGGPANATFVRDAMAAYAEKHL